MNIKDMGNNDKIVYYNNGIAEYDCYAFSKNIILCIDSAYTKKWSCTSLRCYFETSDIEK